ncbi:MAG: hypothetical protein ACREUA_07595, partial [Burkholderiales bacterium]
GKLDATFDYAAQAPGADTLFDSARAGATFQIRNGALGNVNLINHLQSAKPGGVVARQTPFDEASGTLSYAGGRFQYRQLKLSSPKFAATGSVDILPDQKLSGRVSAETASKARGRSSFNVAGTLKQPLLK